MKMDPSRAASDPSPARLLIYDPTPRSIRDVPLISAPLRLGSSALTLLGRFDGCFHPRNWAEAFGWLLFVGRSRPIAEVQVWSHGVWGEVLLQQDRLTTACFCESHPLFPLIRRLRSVWARNALVWFRTCATFGSARGIEFATAAAEALGCRVAGHTYAVHAWQSGLHSVRPGADATWDASEGIRRNAAGVPRQVVSGRNKPNTVSAFRMVIPEGIE